ncbi:MAG: serine hydrolase [Terriglobales bacterium]
MKGVLPLLLLFASLVTSAQVTTSTVWPTNGWPESKPGAVAIDEKQLEAFDADIASGKYPLTDSMLVIRCGHQVYERKHPHDYGKIYAKEAHEKGPLNARLTGPYNYFDPYWHPYYHGTDEHTMQSVSKTVTSVTIGIAITRKDFTAGLDTPVLNYFDASKVANVDDRKRHMTIRDVLTMTTGLDWDEETPYDDPRNAASLMEATDDWVKFVIDRPMAHEPGTVFAYSSGATELLAYIFKKQTGQDIEEYARKYLFTPLGVEHYYWKRNPVGLVDTEGGLYLRAEDLAKIGYLYLHDGMWAGTQIVSADWVKQSLIPRIDSDEGSKYGFQWWLFPHGEPQRLAWAALGLGGQRLLVFPEDDLIVVFTAWDILGNDSFDTPDAIQRILPGVHPYNCSMSAQP